MNLFLILSMTTLFIGFITLIDGKMLFLNNVDAVVLNDLISAQDNNNAENTLNDQNSFTFESLFEDNYGIYLDGKESLVDVDGKEYPRSYYSEKDLETSNNINEFYTEDEKYDGVFNIAVVGDLGCTNNTIKTVENIQSKDPELVIAAGDLSYEASAQCWMEIIEPLKSKMKIAMGDHEYSDTNGGAEGIVNEYMKPLNLTKTYYSFDKNNVHVTIMDPYIDYKPGSTQYEFVEQDLRDAASNPKIDWTFVVESIPIYSATSKHEGDSDIRDIYHPLFDKYGVDLVFSSDNHNYQRTFPLKYNNGEEGADHPIVTHTSQNNIYYNKNDGDVRGAEEEIGEEEEGVIYLIIGTGGQSLYEVEEATPFVASYYDKQFGFLNIDVYSNDALRGTFYANEYDIYKDEDNNNNDDDDYYFISTATANPTTTTTSEENFTFLSQEGKAEDTFIVTKIPKQQVVESQAYKRFPELTQFAIINDSSTSFYKYAPFGTFFGNNSIYIKHNDSLNLTEFTLSTWFRIGEDIPLDFTRQYLVTKGGTGSDSPGENMNYGLNFRNKDATIRGGFEDIHGNHATVASRNPVNYTQWHYVTITYNGSDLIMYLDGKQIDKQDTKGSVPDNTGKLPLLIGANINDKDYFNGDIDEVRLWNKTLEAKEVKKAYEEGIFPTEGQVLHLPFSNASSPILPPPPLPPPTKDIETLTDIKNVDCQPDTAICEEIPPLPSEDNPLPTNSGGINQQAAMNFIKNSYNPSVQMLEEAPGFNTFWLWNDQLLGQIILKHIYPELATIVENKMNSFGVTMRTPWATLDPKYRSNFSVNSSSEPTIQTGPPAIRYSDYNGSTELSVNDYADIAFLSAIHHYYNNNMTLAQQAYDAGRAMWNGQGMDDAGNITGEYAVYKVALGMLAEKITGFTAIGIPANWFAPFQNANGGITTDKTSGVPSGSQNIETTVAVLLATDPSLLTNP